MENQMNNSSIEQVDKFKVKVTSTLNIEDINLKKREVLQVFKNLKVPGNRPGKASDQAIMMHHKDRFKDTLVRALAETAYHNAIAEQKLRPLGMPQFQSLDLSPLESQFTCTFEILNQPDFDLPDFKTWTLVRPAPVDVTSTVEEQIQLAREQDMEMVPFTETDSVAPTDQIIINLETIHDGKRLDIASGEGQSFIIPKDIESNTFQMHLLGMKPGQKNSFDFKGTGHYEGQMLHADVEILSAGKRILHPVDDQLAQKFGCQDMQDFRTKVASAVDAQQQKIATQKMILALHEKIRESFDFEVPDFLVEGEAKILSQKLGEWDSLEPLVKEGLKKQALGAIRSSFVLNKISEEIPTCQLGDMEALQILENVLRQQIGNDEVVLRRKLDELRQNQKLPIIITRLKEEFVAEKLLDQVTIVD